MQQARLKREARLASRGHKVWHASTLVWSRVESSASLTADESGTSGDAHTRRGIEVEGPAHVCCWTSQAGGSKAAA